MKTETEETLYVVGHTAEGEICLLEKVYISEDPAERVMVWSDPKMSAPFHHNVRLATQRVVTTLTYVEERV